MATDDDTLNQLFPGEQFNLYVGSKVDGVVGSLFKYTGYITNYKKSGFSNDIAVQRSAGTYGVARKGVTLGTVSFSAVIMGSDLLNLSHSLKSNPATGYTQFELDDSDKLFKIKLEFSEETDGSLGSPIPTAANAYKEVYYNARSITFDQTLEAEGYLKGDFNFTVPPFNEIGSSNYYELVKNAGRSLVAWGSVENLWDTKVNW